MASPLNKHPAILDLIARLRERLGPDAFTITDHWESDLAAIGISSPRNAGVLAYLSCYGEPDGRFNVELELPPSPGDDVPYQVAGRYWDLDFETLASIVSDHLGGP